MRVSDLEKSAIQVLTEETGATDVKAYPVDDELILADDDRRARVHIHYTYPQWVMARVGRGSSTRKRLGLDSIRAAVRRAKRIDEALAEAAALIREDGRFSLVDGSFVNSILLSRSDDPSSDYFRVWITFYGSSLVVTNRVPWDGPMVEEVKRILRGR